MGRVSRLPDASVYTDPRAKWQSGRLVTERVHPSTQGATPARRVQLSRMAAETGGYCRPSQTMVTSKLDPSKR